MEADFAFFGNIKEAVRNLGVTILHRKVVQRTYDTVSFLFGFFFVFGKPPQLCDLIENRQLLKKYFFCKKNGLQGNEISCEYYNSCEFNVINLWNLLSSCWLITIGIKMKYRASREVLPQLFVWCKVLSVSCDLMLSQTTSFRFFFKEIYWIFIPDEGGNYDKVIQLPLGDHDRSIISLYFVWHQK